MKCLLKILIISALFCISHIQGFSFGATPPNNPTKIDTTAFITDIQSLDELNEQVQVDVIFQLEWNDPRLAFDAKKARMKYKLYQGDFQYDEIFEGWRPQISIINEIGSPQIKSRQIRIYPNGHIIYKEQRTLTLETPMRLAKFPFDKQSLKAYIIPFGYDYNEVQLRINPEYKVIVKDYVKNNPNVNIAEWQLKNYTLEEHTPIKQYYGKSNEISMLTLAISLDRKPTNILWKVLLPLSLLVLAMWAIFWMNKEALSDRLNISFIGILSVIAYQFLVEGEMPRIDYFTFTDGFLLISFSILFSTILESLIVYWFISINKKTAAKAIDIFFRIAFPLGYLILIASLYLVYMH